MEYNEEKKQELVGFDENQNNCQLINNNKQNNLIKKNLYKTELCKYYIENGSCQFGDKCVFAHGKKELNVRIKHLKFKTEVCKQYWENGECRFGVRCHYIHTPNPENIALCSSFALKFFKVVLNNLKKKKIEVNKKTKHKLKIFEDIFQSNKENFRLKTEETPLTQDKYLISKLKQNAQLGITIKENKKGFPLRQRNKRVDC
ncbi:protein tis11 [Anaeramoeba flamelloides]|uniref:Protein tis11 n=1 Tax=Anaeramoeba flamelloides TaxID=1746091 RepID=A0AAV7ZXW0_9EUKA|nr:protein tis11 [Anaeramoeba flamelloides]